MPSAGACNQQSMALHFSSNSLCQSFVIMPYQSVYQHSPRQWHFFASKRLSSSMLLAAGCQRWQKRAATKVSCIAHSCVVAYTIPSCSQLMRPVCVQVVLFASAPELPRLCNGQHCFVSPC